MSDKKGTYVPMNEQPQKNPFAGPFVDPFADPVTPYDDPPSYGEGIKPRDNERQSSTAYNPYAPSTSAAAAASPFEPLRQTQVTSNQPPQNESGRQRADSVASDFLDLPPPTTAPKKKSSCWGIKGWHCWILGTVVVVGCFTFAMIYSTKQVDAKKIDN